MGQVEEMNKPSDRNQGNADRQALERMSEQGVDLASIRDVEFSAFAPDLETANKVVSDVDARGYKGSVFYSEATGTYSVYIRKKMCLRPDEISAERERINALLGEHSMICDGWEVATFSSH
jgi:hypothetical protein